MLRELTVVNLALIDRLRLEFEPGLNIMTGETGAGKSIIIDAVNLVLGGRSSTELLRAGTESAQVEAVFELETNSELDGILVEWGVPLGDDRLLVINREVYRAGRSRCRVNGRTVPVLALNKIGGHLMDIHGQHAHQSLLATARQRELLDDCGGEVLRSKAREVAVLYERWQEIRKALSQVTLSEEEKNRKIEFLTFQSQEIEAARLRAGEEEELAEEKELLAGAERLFEAASGCYQLLYGGDEPGSALDRLLEGRQILEKVVTIDPRLRPFEEMLGEAAAQVEEVAREIRLYREKIEFNPAQLAVVEERLDEIYKLKRKYGKSIPEILAYAKKVREELEAIEGEEERLEELAEELAEIEKKLAVAAGELTEFRRKTAVELEKLVSGHLAEVNMGKTVFKAALTREKDEENGLPLAGEKLAVTREGFDRVEFLVAPNPGEGLRPLAKIASGGELSRLMLVLKVVLAEKDNIPSMVFDEVDAGIGGRTAQVVAEKLLFLSGTHQVICVTHLPQIASMARQHFFIQKKTAGKRTRVEVRSLKQEERVDELARMLGGAEVTSTTREHAREMLALAASVGKKPPLFSP